MRVPDHLRHAKGRDGLQTAVVPPFIDVVLRSADVDVDGQRPVLADGRLGGLTVVLKDIRVILISVHHDRIAVLVSTQIDRSQHLNIHRVGAPPRVGFGHLVPTIVVGARLNILVEPVEFHFGQHLPCWHVLASRPTLPIDVIDRRVGDGVRVTRLDVFGVPDVDMAVYGDVPAAADIGKTRQKKEADHNKDSKFHRMLPNKPDLFRQTLT